MRRALRAHCAYIDMRKEEVSGSCFLLETAEHGFRVDCRIFQGGREVRRKDSEALDFDLRGIDFVLLTRVHVGADRERRARSQRRRRTSVCHGCIRLPENGRALLDTLDDRGKNGEEWWLNATNLNLTLRTSSAACQLLGPRLC